MIKGDDIQPNRIYFAIKISKFQKYEDSRSAGLVHGVPGVDADEIVTSGALRPIKERSGGAPSKSANSHFRPMCFSRRPATILLLHFENVALNTFPGVWLSRPPILLIQ
jgi:hypothetical protein